MGFLADFKAYTSNRLKSYVEVIAKSLSATLITWTLAVIGGVVAIATGGNPNWGAIIAVGLGATSQLLVTIIRAMLGKPYNEEEPAPIQ